MASNAVRKADVLHLYKVMMRESQKFSSYNYRNYALRRVRDAFKDNKTLTDPDSISDQVRKAQKNLGVIRRQVVVGNFYQSEKLIIEHPTSV